MTVALATRVRTYIGLSSDQKPDGVAPGSRFVEFDTKLEYVYAPATGLVANPTNVITNGGFESNPISGWLWGGANTIERSAEQQHAGVASLKCTYQDSSLLAGINVTLTAVPYYAAAWLYIPTSYNGSALSARWTGYTGATNNDVAVTADMAIRDIWQRLVFPVLTPAGDVAGQFQAIRQIGTPPTAGRYVYIDDARADRGGSWKLLT